MHMKVGAVFTEADDGQVWKKSIEGIRNSVLDISSLKCLPVIQVKISSRWLAMSLRVNIEIVFKAREMDKVIQWKVKMNKQFIK